MALDDLMNIMDSLQAAPVVSRPKDEVYALYPALALPLVKPEWQPADHIPKHILWLSEYQRHWLEWRLIVHLRSYEAMEWSEMKQVLTDILAQLKGIKDGNTGTGGTTGQDPNVKANQDSSQSGPNVL